MKLKHVLPKSGSYIILSNVTKEYQVLVAMTGKFQSYFVGVLTTLSAGREYGGPLERAGSDGAPLLGICIYAT